MLVLGNNEVDMSNESSRHSNTQIPQNYQVETSCLAFIDSRHIHISIFLRDVPPAKSRSSHLHLREAPGGSLKDVVTRGVDKLLGE